MQSHAQLFFPFTSNLRAYVCLRNTSVLRQFFAFYQNNFKGEYIIARMTRVCLGILHVTHADPTRLCQLEEIVGDEAASEAKTETASGNRHSHHPSDWLAVAMIRTLTRKPISSPLPLVRHPKPTLALTIYLPLANHAAAAAPTKDAKVTYSTLTTHHHRQYTH